MEYHHPNTVADPAFEVTHVHTAKVFCEGSAGAMGHPRVYLTIEHETGQIVCPYCSRMFVYDGAGHEHH